MTSQNMIKALELLYWKIKNSGVRWVLTGSMSLALQGVDVEPNDIDILTDRRGAFAISKALRSHEIKKVKYSETAEVASFFGIFEIEEVKVKVMGDCKEKQGSRWISLSNRLENPRIVKINKMRIPVSPIEDQLASYKRSKRPEDIGNVTRILIALWSSSEDSRESSEQPLETLREVGLAGGMTFLDVGCGIGFYSFYASAIVGEKGFVYALDRKPEFITFLTEKAKRQGVENITAVVADAHETGLPSESVDIVFLHLVLHGLKDKPRAINEFSRILKEKGRLVINEENITPVDTVRELAEHAGFRFAESTRETVQIFEKARASSPSENIQQKRLTEVDLTNEIIAYCGLDCSKCPSYLATMKNDTAALESIARRWPSDGTRITAEDVACEGCFGPRLSKYCLENCAIRRCACGRKIKNCAYCNEYKCQKLAELMQKVPKIADKLDAIRRQRDSSGRSIG